MDEDILEGERVAIPEEVDFSKVAKSGHVHIPDLIDAAHSSHDDGRKIEE